MRPAPAPNQGFFFATLRQGLRVRGARVPSPPLLCFLQAAVFDKVRPLLDVAAEEFLERRRVFADRLEPDLAQLGLGVRVARDVHQGRAELFTDGWGYAGGPHDAHPSRGV